VSGQTQIGRLRALYPNKVLPWPERDGWVEELRSAGLVERTLLHNRLGYRLMVKGRQLVERSQG
jgi:hypothetical protein